MHDTGDDVIAVSFRCPVDVLHSGANPLPVIHAEGSLGFLDLHTSASIVLPDSECQSVHVFAGELLVGPKRVVFADEISTGLDSSTTYQIVKWMRDQAHTQQTTMLVALLQPAPETFELFDDVMLIAEGAVLCLVYLQMHSADHFEAACMLFYICRLYSTSPRTSACMMTGL